MCLAIPGIITSIDGLDAEVDFGGVARRAALDLVPQAKQGDYVLVHAGFAIQIMSEKDARDTIGALRELYEQ